MRGPEVIARTMSIPQPMGASGVEWQYHSRSDRHSKVACWAVMFDLLNTSSLLREHVAAGKVSLAINRQMNNFQTGQRKNLDLVVARATGGDTGAAVSLDELAARYAIQLDESDRSALSALPESPIGAAGSTVLVALEAKACMTKHAGAGPRLFDELSSSHSTVHGDNNNALAVGFAMVNYADRFASPVGATNRNGPHTYSRHNQPAATEAVIRKLREINRRSGPHSGQAGFDAFGIIVVELENDGSPMRIVTEPPAPQPDNDFFYDRMIVRTAHLYDANFSHV
ncbi:hypothetical protein [Mycobacterium angelicum]|uniref:Uncharacterized protein n=1 Tax=Mycobacterium angelicum TaxID=470074 RepID=A0A1W9ZUA0_MYCAN|nr:hypothetical protein [Mycobacterium angelicum]MCV7199966.1 hypothetical protein [Mycobacterium angelicum]ORA21379.1 hypothetical protein BST12_12275 [Mycobacterium angelicum]